MARRIAFLFLALTLPAAGLEARPADAGLEGRWRLAEQRYERGQANQVDDTDPLVLEVHPGGTGLAARVRRGSTGVTRPWPAVTLTGSPAPATSLIVEEATLDATRGIVRARWRAGHPGRGIVMHVTEEYALDPGGALVGTVTVQLSDDGEDRGAYRLHRRFERAP